MSRGGKKEPNFPVNWIYFIYLKCRFSFAFRFRAGDIWGGHTAATGHMSRSEDSLQDFSLLFHDAGSGIKLGSDSFLTASADARRNLLYWACPEQEILMISSSMILRERSIVWINRMWISFSVLREVEKEWEWMTDETLKRFIFATESYSLKIYILRKD